MPSDTPSDQTLEERFEYELGEVLRRAGGGFAPVDRPALVDAGVARGRRRRARRRTAVAAGGAFALVAVGLGGGYGSGLLGGAGTHSVSMGADESAGLTTGPQAVPGDDLAATLATLLPAGKLAGVQVSKGPELLVRGVFDDGKGAAEVSVALAPASGAFLRGDEANCPDSLHLPNSSCTSTKLSDGGGVLMVFQGNVYADLREKTKVWRAVLRTVDGHVIEANEYNAPAEKGAAVSRTDPPLDPARLRALVTSDLWHGHLDTLPAPSPDGTGSGAPESAVDAAKVMRLLLPAGLEVVDRGGQEGDYGYLVVDDGKGRSLVQINVQPGSGDLRGALFGSDPTTLPNGTLLREQASGGDKDVAGAVMWTVDTLTVDGLRVVVSAFNAGDQLSPPSRPEPALTMEQLAAIATSEEWTGR
ncbi:hypothetical protein [Streptomyces paludis]|uniref:LigA protein n=1 Tax=Streptomyces paludis TaxID=2282738 RepID=A0A345HPE4_9ACTN|nr:hypothetical protein [Streptomyces paludis]AXG78568.1 hypothetical protein DVK44_13525 [Streptomyces paludis]